MDFPLHSTPIKGHTGYDASVSHFNLLSALKAEIRPVETPGKHQHLTDMSSLNSMHASNNESLLKKQQDQLKLLTSELRDRDNELNAMVSSHQSQLDSWTRDRQSLLASTQQNVLYQGEINDNKIQLKKLAGFIKMLKEDITQRTDVAEKSKSKIAGLDLLTENQSAEIQTLKMQSSDLKNAINEKSSALGHLEAREHELLTVLRIKEEELQAVLSNNCSLTERITHFETEYSNIKGKLSTRTKERDDIMKKYSHYKTLAQQLHGALKIQKTQSKTSQDQLVKCQSAVSELRQQLHLAGERESHLTALIESQKDKHDRLSHELLSLRQLCNYTQLDVGQYTAGIELTSSVDKQHITPSNSKTESMQDICENHESNPVTDNVNNTEIMLQKTSNQTPNVKITNLSPINCSDSSYTFNSDDVNSQQDISLERLSTSNTDQFMNKLHRYNAKLTAPVVDWEERKAVLESSMLRNSLSLEENPCSIDYECGDKERYVKNVSMKTQTGSVSHFLSDNERANKIYLTESDHTISCEPKNLTNTPNIGKSVKDSERKNHLPNDTLFPASTDGSNGRNKTAVTAHDSLKLNSKIKTVGNNYRTTLQNSPNSLSNVITNSECRMNLHSITVDIDPIEITTDTNGNTESPTKISSFHELYEKFVADLDIPTSTSNYLSDAIDHNVNDTNAGNSDLYRSDLDTTTRQLQYPATSPSSKLFRLLQESQTMIHQLEQTSAPYS